MNTEIETFKNDFQLGSKILVKKQKEKKKMALEILSHMQYTKRFIVIIAVSASSAAVGKVTERFA